jgi:hypothetical protein
VFREQSKDGLKWRVIVVTTANIKQSNEEPLGISRFL